MKRKLQSVADISFSGHFFEPKVRLRKIDGKEIIQNLKSPKRLEFVEDQGSDSRGHKYMLLFRKSNKYDLKIIVSFKRKKLNVITTHIQNKKRRKVYEKWLKKLR